MLAIAGALVCKPELLLVDELSLGLAPVVVDDLMARLLQIKRELGITILLVEQSAAVALDVADYSYVLENGRIVLDGDSARLLDHPDIQEFYLGQSSGGSAAATATSSNTAAAGGGMAELEVENLSLRFGGLTVLEGLSFAVEPAELFALIGPNGAGKTSALQLHQPHLPRRGPHPLPRPGHLRPVAARGRRLGIARTFQHVELFPHMSVLDNIMTGRHARLATNPLQRMLFLPAVRREEVRHREAVERIIEFVELEGVRHAPCRRAALRHPEDRRPRPRAGAGALAAAARRALRRPHPRRARRPRPLHPAHQARPEAADDLDRARHADGRRPRRPRPRAQLRPHAWPPARRSRC